MKDFSHAKEVKAIDEYLDMLEGYREVFAFGILKAIYGQLNTDKIISALYLTTNYKKSQLVARTFIYILSKNGIHIDFNSSELVFNLDKSVVDEFVSILEPVLKDEPIKEHINFKSIRELSKLNGLGKDRFKVAIIFEDTKSKSLEIAYLKLSLISSGFFKPRELNLDGIFALLPNVAWSNSKPIELDYLRKNEVELKIKEEFPHIDYIDKFPRYLSHIVPYVDNIRILDSSKVRFGAYISPGTTVMPGASYINFNAGTLGDCMVEGRVSSSAVVGSGTDIGGGASILGVLSGTDGEAISIGKNCLLGANCVVGISLGDGCIVDAGVAILAGTKISISDTDVKSILSVNTSLIIDRENLKAKDLSGANGLHFRYNSVDGNIMVKRSIREIKLNEELH